MDNPREDTATSHFITHGAFTVAAVRADPETNGLEVTFAAVNVQLKAKYREASDLEETLHEKDAILIVRDRIGDKIVRSIELRLLDMVNKNRDDARYRRYFPDGLRAVTEANPRTVEPKRIRDIIKTLDEDQSKPGFDTIYSEFRNKLLAAVEAVEAAAADIAQIEEQFDFLTDKVTIELRQQWVESRTKLHAELTLKFPTDANRVEGYFLRFAKPRKKK